jgi:large subunit ribosomal protein L13e
MPKHNNIIPNVHLHKGWERFVRTWFDQAARKKTRRINRARKAARVFPRPVKGPLRPIVHSQTVKYNRKKRMGRGFTHEELKLAGINRREARGIGICVDHRRTNLSEKTLQENAQRLRTYKAKLVVFPRNPLKPKKGEATKAQRKSLRQHRRTLIPIKKEMPKITYHRITQRERTSKGAFFALRQAKADARLVGRRKKIAAKKAAAAELAAKK